MPRKIRRGAQHAVDALYARASVIALVFDARGEQNVIIMLIAQMLAAPARGATRTDRQPEVPREEATRMLMLQYYAGAVHDAFDARCRVIDVRGTRRTARAMRDSSLTVSASVKTPDAILSRRRF